MRHAFVVTKPGSARARLLADLAALGCAPPWQGEVDLRDASAVTLLREDRVSHAAFLALAHGRSDDHSIPSAGGVGCYLSHLEACRRVSQLPPGDLALVVEADCELAVPTMEAAITSVEQGASLSAHDPHVVFFGAFPLRGCTLGADELCGAEASAVRPVPGTDAVLQAALPGAVAVRAHCCLYTVSGASFVLRHLEGRPVDVQWDSALSVLSALPTGSARSFLWWCSVGAGQKLHISSIQDVCFPCMLRGALPAILLVGCVLVALLVGALIGSRGNARLES